MGKANNSNNNNIFALFNQHRLPSHKKTSSPLKWQSNSKPSHWGKSLPSTFSTHSIYTNHPHNKHFFIHNVTESWFQSATDWVDNQPITIESEYLHHPSYNMHPGHFVAYLLFSLFCCCMIFTPKKYPAKNPRS